MEDTARYLVDEIRQHLLTLQKNTILSTCDTVDAGIRCLGWEKTPYTAQLKDVIHNIVTVGAQFPLVWTRGKSHLRLVVKPLCYNHQHAATPLIVEVEPSSNTDAKPSNTYPKNAEQVIEIVKQLTVALDNPIPKGFKTRLRKATTRAELLNLLHELEDTEIKE